MKDRNIPVYTSGRGFRNVHKLFFLNYIFETKFYFVAQTGLELVQYSLAPSQVYMDKL